VVHCRLHWQPAERCIGDVFLPHQASDQNSGASPKEVSVGLRVAKMRGSLRILKSYQAQFIGLFRQRHSDRLRGALCEATYFADVEDGWASRCGRAGRPDRYRKSSGRPVGPPAGGSDPLGGYHRAAHQQRNRKSAQKPLGFIPAFGGVSTWRWSFGHARSRRRPIRRGP